MGRKRLKCSSCGEAFWVDRDAERANTDYFCPYCGEAKDVD